MKIITVLAVLAVLFLAAVLGSFLWVRSAPIDAARLHRDPAETRDPGGAGVRILPPEAPVWAVPPGEAMAALDRAIRAEGRVELIAGSPEEGFATYIIRTAFWGFPDVVNVKVIEAPGGSTVALRSRSIRAGYDWGVNQARAARWFAAVPAGA